MSYKKGAVGTGGLILAGLLIVGAMVFLFQTKIGGGPGIPGVPLSVQPATTAAPGQAVSFAGCNDAATNGPELRLALRNPLNTSGDEFLARTLRLYSGNFDANNLPPDNKFVTTFATVATGLPALGSGSACGCGQTYTAVSPSVDNSSVSAIVSGLACKNRGEPEAAKVINAAQQAQLVFKVYDESARAYVYETTETTAGGAFRASGSTFYNTTNNNTGAGTGLIVGQDGQLTYTVSTEINTTAATDTQFEDLETYIAFDIQSQTQWQKPTSITSSGATFTEIACPLKLVSNGYDICYKAEVGSKALHLASTQVDVKVAFQAKPGVNPSDDIVMAFATKAMAKSNANNGMISGVNLDDSGLTYLITPASLTFVVT